MCAWARSLDVSCSRLSTSLLALFLATGVGVSAAAGTGWEPLGLEGLRVDELSTNGEYVYALTIAESDAYDESVWRVRTDGTGTPELIWDTAGGVAPWTVACHPLSPDTVYIGLNGPYPVPDPVLLRSTDGGATFAPFVAGLCDSDGGVSRIFASATTPSLLAVAADDVVHLADSGDESWTPVPGTEGCPCGIGCGEFTRRVIARGVSDLDVLWLVNNNPCSGSDVYRSLDAGATWTNILHDCNSMYRLTVDPTNADRVYLFQPHDARRSLDGGETWVQMALPEGANRLVVDAVNSGLLYANDIDGTFWWSGSYGILWSPVDTSTLPAKVSRIVVHPTVSGLVFVSTAAESGLFKRQLDVSAVSTGSPAPVPGRDLTLVAQPNPFAGSTRLQLAGSASLPAVASRELRVFDTAGRLVRELVWQPGSRGTPSVVWDGRDGAGELVSPGVYIVKLEEGDGSASARVVKVR